MKKEGKEKTSVAVLRTAVSAALAALLAIFVFAVANYH